MSALNFINGFFGAPLFFWAGLLCAFGPVIIHLLNRRRYRVVQWAAMDFLREALQRNRRIMQFRDMLLLALRTLAMLMLGLALAQARCTSSSEKFDGSHPLHAILLVDNSLSMGYQGEQSLGEDLLDRARQRAKEYIGKLPADSRVSVIPLCGSRHALSADAYSKEDALEALDKIEVVDGSAKVQQAINKAVQAGSTGPDLERRILLLGDQQVDNWTGFKGSPEMRDLPPIQVVDVSAADYENAWVSDLRVPDGLADVETPTSLIVELRHRGASSRQNLQVTLSIDGVEAASKTVTLEPGEGDSPREVAFEHLFSAYQPEPGKPVSAAIKATITPSDRLPADDERHLVINVVAALPVVFVDQFGADEEHPVKSQLGETRHLRKLLAPVTSRGESPRQLVKIHHVKIDELSRDLLSDARLVVVAGVADPGESVPLLREYVEQGGQLMIAAGAEFKAQLWNDAAWLDGAGILPTRLLADPIGALPEESRENVKPFTLSFESLGTHDYFRLPDATDDELRDLYAEPFFFKAVVADLSPAALAGLKTEEAQRLEQSLSLAAQAQARREKLAPLVASGELSDEQRDELAADESKLAELQPNWLLWKNPVAEEEVGPLPTEEKARATRLEQLAEATLPTARARFADEQGTPYLVERNIGRGQVLFVSSGLLSQWNTLPKTNTFLIFDRMMRRMIEATLPNRNFDPAPSIRLSVPLDDQLTTVSLRRPGREDTPEVLDAGFIGEARRGVTVNLPLARGLYRVTAMGDASAAVGRDRAATPEAGVDAVGDPDRPLWEMPLSVNGQADESNLASLTRESFEQRAAETNLLWVGASEEISLAGTQIRGQNMWWYLIALLMVLLFVEMAIFSWPSLSGWMKGGLAT